MINILTTSSLLEYNGFLAQLFNNSMKKNLSSLLMLESHEDVNTILVIEESNGWVVNSD